MKKRLEPCLEEAGFAGRYPHFRRLEAGELQLLSIVHDKWGGGFVLEFAKHPPGPYTTPWGAVIEEVDLDVAYVSPERRARLVHTTRGQGTYEDFFRYDAIADERPACEGLIAEVVARFPQVDAWLRTGVVGPNIAAFAPADPTPDA